jgi:hypothetical protein
MTGSDVMEKIGTEFGERMQSHRPIFVMWAAEAWMSKDTKVAPSKAKDRESIIATSLLAADGRSKMCVQSIKKDNTLGRARYSKGDAADRPGLAFFRGYVLSGSKLSLK